MTDYPASVPALGDDVLHVRLLAYRREQGRAPLIETLARYLGIAAHEVQLHTEPHGRPVLDAAHGLSFNWSHCDDRAVIVLARGVTPGIDIERWRRRPRAMEIAQRYFSPDEARALEALPPAQRDEAFLRLWTAKEALLKATGRGIAFGLHRMHVEWSAGRPDLRWMADHRAADWQLHAPDVGPAHVAALAWRGTPRRIAFFRDGDVG